MNARADPVGWTFQRQGRAVIEHHAGKAGQVLWPVGTQYGLTNGG
jgi:hypothetical protein